jgi:hypothetical protein
MITAPPGSLSDFEFEVRDGARQITGVVLDPDTDEIIGYRTGGSGVYQIVDREGNFLEGGEASVEKPLVDPIDFIPTPGAIAKGVTVVGKVGLKVFGKFAAKETATEGLKISAAALPRLRGVSLALFGRAVRAATKEMPVIARSITEEGLSHSFDRHAAQWFGRVVDRSTHYTLWRQVIERAMQSTQVFPWSVGATKTIAHLATIEGKPFMVQFSKETGELVTAFVPSQRQLKAARGLLELMK